MNSYEQFKSLHDHRIIIYIVSLLIIILFFVLNAKINQIYIEWFDKYHMVVISVVLLLFSILGIIWIFFNDTVPHSDQSLLYEEARKIAGYNLESFNHIYMTAYKRQRGIVLLIAVLMKLFGDSQLGFRLYNVLALVLLVCGINVLVKKIFANRSILITNIILLIFYPIIIYTCYIYGTLSAVTFEVWGFWATIIFIEKNKFQYGIFAAFLFGIGAFMHQSALIGLIAGMIIIWLNVEKRRLIIQMVVIGLYIGIIFVGNIIVNSVYESVTGCPRGDELPAMTTIYMGMNADFDTGSWAGPGSSDASEMDIYISNNRDSAAASEEAKRRVRMILGEYLTGKRSLKFFVDKVKYQWLDPTFDAHRIILLNNKMEGEPDNSEKYEAFYYSEIRQYFVKLVNVLMIAIYFLALFSGIYDLLNRKKNVDSINILIRLFFVGGFVFQLMWEGLSRYCISYYILLLIEGVYGIEVILELFDKKITNK